MDSLLDEMQKLSSAEEFLGYFGLDYDPKVVSVSRLHILKRFNQYLGREGGVAGLAPAVARAKCRELLTRAYADFVHSSGVEEKVFKVFKQGTHSVSVDSLRSSLGGSKHA
jgi:nitrogenase-stabilizing/protective protein